MEIQQIGDSFGTKLDNFLRTVLDYQYFQCPCRVTAVNGNYVDVLPIINDDEKNQELYDVKIRHLESSTAYIYLSVHVGDRGVLRFFDRNISDYSTNGSEEYNGDDRIHDANDGCFELGFVPDSESYVYPVDKEIEIALKSGNCKISVVPDGTLNVVSTIAMNVTAPTITINGNVTVNGTITATGEIQGNNINLSTHTHIDSMGGGTSVPS